MPSKSKVKKTAKRIRKNKTMLKVIVAFLLIIAISIAIIYFAFPDTYRKYRDLLFGKNVAPDYSAAVGQVTLQEGDLSVHYLQLGNKNCGDSVLIKNGDIEVLIDAGSKSDSIETISAYIDTYCSDGVLEYVIVTHAHEDHIACLGGTANAEYRTIFDRYVVETIIDFPLTNSTSQLYNRYVAERDAEVAQGAKHYTALQCWNNEGGAKRNYDLGDGVSLNILYNYYYEHTTSNENDYSVCCMITDGDKNFLFTGDLEKKGEEYLVQYNNLPQVTAFKAGHHGSETASNDVLIDVIKPQIVCITTVMGTLEYSKDIAKIFPAKRVCRSFEKYTNNIYVTSMYDSATDTYGMYNGNIVLVSNADGVKVVCSNHSKKLNESPWYQANRQAA